MHYFIQSYAVRGEKGRCEGPTQCFNNGKLTFIEC